ncbi:hypothetical protein KA005_25420, partial [bacterium]|nr:hypothetical protein [bacterium]
MKKTTFFSLFIALSITIFSNPYEYKIGKDELKSDFFGCTIIMAARNGLVFAGNNEDRDQPETIVSFIPASKKYYGK